jgi:hypothetical protein
VRGDEYCSFLVGPGGRCARLIQDEGEDVVDGENAVGCQLSLVMGLELELGGEAGPFSADAASSA